MESLPETHPRIRFCFEYYESRSLAKNRCILEEVMETAADSRPAFLNKICDGDAEFRREVESLLEFENGAADTIAEAHTK